MTAVSNDRMMQHENRKQANDIVRHLSQTLQAKCRVGNVENETNSKLIKRFGKAATSLQRLCQHCGISDVFVESQCWHRVDNNNWNVLISINQKRFSEIKISCMLCFAYPKRMCGFHTYLANDISENESRCKQHYVKLWRFVANHCSTTS